MRISTFIRLVDGVNDKIGKGVIYLILIIIFLAALEVTLRYVFDKPTLWVWTVNRQLLLLTVCLGGAYALQHGHFIKLDLFTKRFTGRFKLVSDIWSLLFGLLFSSIILWQGSIFFLNSLISREEFVGTLGVAIYPIKFFIPLAGFLLFVQTIANFVRKYTVIDGVDYSKRKSN